ncbi:thiamine pyrophosphate-dependent enzyme [Halothermothrix orenii]|uniref:Pyruvate ferredoxin oxidoreductase, beta subunit n=1 Tax=Halothermothrix orenii (strain H 168 / OCM 544 / DSM 9562) TaxID=373903 RepID=B8CZW4_HALOH|nr:thiamine pyrophosphate-dependent enzyme [Halothermothrix orenii]ACL70816.1 pyruvate ferredoxin oxidoreductase, beta subunit [Halothermothrix orenii H 168]
MTPEVNQETNRAQIGEEFTSGHRLCQGCGASIIVHNVLKAVDTPVVVSVATGCLEVSSSIYPQSAWNCSFIHNAFENAAATLSGVETAYRALKKQGRIDDEFTFIAFGGDGGTYDIGFQSLSGAMERGHDMVYICYDNQAYMNTGIQRSSATPQGANTTTSPVGSVIPGKKQFRKDITEIMAAHNIPYAAQASPYHWKDLRKKVKKAVAIDGPAFINVLSVCPRGWRTAESKGMEITKIAVETLYWPLYEIEEGQYHITHKPKKIKPVEEWLKPQGRFKHLFKEENKDIIKILQERVNERWERLLRLAGEK